MTDRYAVMGNPIAHSKSPQIHAHFARCCDQDLTYEALLVPLDGFDAAVHSFFEAGGGGLNITVPFKQQAWALAEQLSDAARLAGAVNTLYRNSDGELCGANTDGVGMVTDIRANHGGEIEGKRVLILGAGGAVRGVLAPVLAERPVKLVIANRTAGKAERLAEEFATLGQVEGCGFDSLAGAYDLIINGTSASLQGERPPLPEGVLAEGGWCYDMMYGADTTPFNRWAEAQGAARAIDGLGMLVEQAAESFRIWRGMRPETGDLIASLRRQLA